MSKVTPARRAALEVLRLVAGGDLLDQAFTTGSTGLEKRDRTWLHELTYGTIRLRGRLDHYLGAFVRGGLDSLEPAVLDVLRLGAYQLLEMNSVPPYAAISQAVDLVREAGSTRASGLVNGVLQALKRGGATVAFPSFAESPVDYLSSWGSHPRWLIERWVERWGPLDTRSLVEANNHRPELFIRPAGVTTEIAIEMLAVRGIEAARVSGFPDSLKILPPAGPIEALASVAAVVQDPAAAAVVSFADLYGRSTIVDLSAAPGGKTVGLASGGARVIAVDRSLRRIRSVRSNLIRTDLAEAVSLVVADGRAPPFRSAEAILLDAPCTGTGTFRRHPDGRWRVSPGDLSSLIRLQRELLKGAASILEIGGSLVYSTCSLEPEENEMQIDWLLTEIPGLRRAAPGPVGDPTMISGLDLRLSPQEQGVDGAFAARLERVE